MCQTVAQNSPVGRHGAVHVGDLNVNTTLTNATGERIAVPEPRPAITAELLDVRAAAVLLGCSPRHVYRLADAGKMPAPVRLGSLVRWNRSALLTWISEGCPNVRRVGKAVTSV